jgi:hypothetical protein
MPLVDIRNIVREELERWARAEPKRCKHEWIEGRNGLPMVHFNGTNAYIQCRKCGQKQQT